MIFWLTILAQGIFNLINSRIDAYRILKNKTIAHAINFSGYAVVIAIELLILKPVWWFGLIFCFSAFLNRQVTFDIPLNLRRRKNDKSITWDYVSKANPPKAWLDRQEIKVFGYNGRAITLTYIFLWVLSLIFSYFLN